MSIRRERELRRMNRLLVRQEAIAERDVAKVFRDMGEALADRLTYGDVEASLQIVDEHRPAMAKVLEKNLRQTALIFGGRTLERISANLPKSYYAGLAPGSGPVRGRDDPGLELKDAREVFESTILRWIKRHALDRAISVMGSAKETVRRVLVESFADGTGEAGTAKLIRERIGKQLSATNAARIARTEMHTASTIGSDTAARSTGLEMIKEWASAEDSRTRASHAAADGDEVPLDEPFSVGDARLMVPGDPSGPAKEIINCRCAVLHHPVIGGMAIRDDGKPSAMRKPPEPVAAVERVFVNAALTNEAIKVRPRATVNKELKARLATHADDQRYGAGFEFRGRKAAQVGASPFGSAAWDDEAATMVAALIPELDAMADALKIPRIRGYVSLGAKSKANADMGDGIMGLNPATFNRRAGLIGDRAKPENVAARQARMAELMASLKAGAEKLDELQTQAASARRLGNLDEANALRAQVLQVLNKHEADRKSYMEEARLADPQGQEGRIPVSNWRPGDPVKERPYSSAYYHKPGLDRARSTMHHEFGHHVHQYLGKTGKRPPDPPMEIRLRAMFAEAKAQGRFDTSPTGYSLHNSQEWFAENFSLYTTGKRELVDPVLRAFIKELFDAAAR